MDQAQSTPLTLSLCMIVKDEDQTLSRCLASAQGYVDEIVIVDTGSQDQTVSIAKDFDAQVSYFTWCNDFAAARNYAISLARGKWILMLDADEELVVSESNFRDYLEAKTTPQVYCLDLNDAYKQSDVSVLWATRLFRNSPDLKYSGRYHEQLTYCTQALNSDSIKHLQGLKIIHYGYGQEELAQKHHHRVEFLEEILETDGINLAWLRTLTSNYQASGDIQKAEQCQAQAFDYLLPYLISGDPPDPFVSGAYWVYSLGVRCLKHEDLETAQLLCQRALEWSPLYPPSSYFAGLLCQSFGLYIGAIAYFKHCIQLGHEKTYDKGEPFDQKITTTFAAQGLGISHSRLQEWSQAKVAFELALSFDPNSQLAQKSLEDINNKL